MRKYEFFIYKYIEDHRKAWERLSLRKRQKISKYLHIFKGASDVFMKSGYNEASISQISRHAGVSKGTIYSYFPSKLQLFQKVIRRLCFEEKKRFRASLPVPSGEFTETLQYVAEAYIRMSLADTAIHLHRTVISVSHYMPIVCELYDKVRQDNISQLYKYFSDEMARDGMPKVSREAVEIFISSCQTRLIFRCQLGLLVDASDQDVRTVAAAATRLFLSALDVPSRPIAWKTVAQTSLENLDD